MKKQILFVAGMQWWGRLEDVIDKKEFDLFCEADPDEADKEILLGKHFDLVICADTVCQEDRNDGLHLANNLKRSGHKVLVLSDFEIKGLPVITSKAFHHDTVGLLVKIHGLIDKHGADVPTSEAVTQ